MTASLEVLGLKRRIGSFELEADFRVAPGARAAIVGPSGTGKTSLLRMIAGLDSVESGSVKIGNEDVTRVVPEKRRFGFLFQEHALFPALGLLQNVAFGLKMQGVPKAEREAQALIWLEKVGLGSRAHDSIDVLSGGERQRVAFARAIVSQPRVLLLDEPFSALDATLKNQLRADLLALLKDYPVPTLLVTHDESDIAALATTRIAVEIQSGPLAGPIERRVFRDAPLSNR